MSHNPVCPLQPLQVCRISWIIVSLHACSDIRSSSISLAANCIMHVPSGFFVHIPHLVFARRFITHETIFPGSIPAPRTSSIHTFCSISKFFIYTSFISSLHRLLRFRFRYKKFPDISLTSPLRLHPRYLPR